MKKIVELLIKDANFESDDLGVDVVSLVETPAIGYTWLAFGHEEFVKPIGGESEDEFIGRCMSALEGEYPDQDQRLAVCYSYWGKDSFESYNDYPEAAKANAQRAIDWAAEHGWGDCGTDVGKQRAHQLAKGEMISEDTIARMASFRRHQQNADTPYGEGCGKLMWDAWGGEEGIAWAERKLKQVREAQCACGEHHEMSAEEEDDLKKVQEEILIAAETLGEEHDPENTTYLTIHNFDENNATVSGIAKAIAALDILVGRKDANEELKTVWKYEGPSAQRRFCRAMMRLSATKFWTTEDIERMSNRAVNPGFGPNGRDTYDIFKYAGGPNCYHAFQEYKMFRNESGKVLLIKTGEGGVPPIQQPNQGWLSRASRSRAASRAARTRNGFKEMKFSVQDEEQRIVVAPAMVPNNLIRRIDENGMEYFVYFSKETVADIAEKFFAKNFTNNTNINHNGDVTKENTILESWIVQDPDHDKSNLYGFNVPEGTWMLSMRINNDETWSKIKEGELQGYSVEGNFLELAK